MSLAHHTLDLVEELRLRRWARENYVPHTDRAEDWHAVIHDEMTRRDQELQVTPLCRGAGIVPLMPNDLLDLHHRLGNSRTSSPLSHHAREHHYN